MARLFYHVMQDNAGNLLFGVSGTMRLAGTGTAATIYGDEALTIPIPNPMTNHPSFGSFKCYLGPGAYDFYMAKSGYTFETLTGVQGLGSLATANSPLEVVHGGTGANNVASARGNLELGGMALQNTNAVSIGGGNITGLASLQVTGGTILSGPVDFQDPTQVRADLALGTMAQQNAASIVVTDAQVNNALGIGQSPVTSRRLSIAYSKASEYGIVLTPLASDTGTQAVLFKNLATSDVGSISTSATATAYNTSSDARLKFNVEDLRGAMDILRQLRPIAHLWKADGSRGHSFLAHEVAEVVDGVVTGEADATNDDGTLRPQQIDLSKLVPWLVAGLKELDARLTALESALA